MKIKHIITLAMALAPLALAQAPADPAVLNAQASLQCEYNSLQEIENIINPIIDHTSAEASAIKLHAAIATYEDAKLKSNMIKDQLTKAQEDQAELPLDTVMDAIEDRIENKAKLIYRQKGCYGCEAIKPLIYKLAD